MALVLAVLPPKSVTVGEFQSLRISDTGAAAALSGDSEAREGHCQLVVVWESGTLVLSYLVSVPGLGFVMGPAFSTRGSKSWA